MAEWCSSVRSPIGPTNARRCQGLPAGRGRGRQALRPRRGLLHRARHRAENGVAGDDHRPGQRHRHRRHRRADALRPPSGRHWGRGPEAALSRRRARRHLLPPVQGRRRPSPPSPRDGHSGGGGGRRVDRRRGGGLGAPDGPGGDHDPFRHCAAASVLGPSTPSKTTVPSPHHRRGCRPRPERARPAQAVGIDMADVGPTLEHQGVGSFTASLDGLLETLEAKRAELARR